MNDTFSEAFEAELATIERLREPSTADPGWGSDLECGDDLTYNVAELAPDDARGVALYHYRMMNTRPGELADDVDWGYDVVSMLNQSMTETERRQFQDTARSQHCRDDRLQNVEFSATFSTDGEEIAIAIELQAELVDSSQSFYLTAVASKTGMNIVELVVNGDSDG